VLVRRAGGGVVTATRFRCGRFDVLVAAYEAGVRVPEPLANLGELEVAP
jgi:hypothetical protein